MDALTISIIANVALGITLIVALFAWPRTWGYVRPKGFVGKVVIKRQLSDYGTNLVTVMNIDNQKVYRDVRVDDIQVYSKLDENSFVFCIEQEKVVDYKHIKDADKDNVLQGQ